MRLGYTLALVPILIKVSAINKLSRGGMGCRRVEIDPNRFKKILSVTISVLFLFLTIWTSLDMPRKIKQYEMGKDNLSDINVYVGCESQRGEWKMAAYVWEFLLLLSATILTFQSRDVIQQLNESSSLAFMVYSHFVFVIARVLTTVMEMVVFLPSASVLKINSLLTSFDALFGMLIYFGPKFFHLMSPQGRMASRKGGDIVNDSNIGSNVGSRVRSHGRTGGRLGRSNISGLNLPRNRDGSIPSLIKPRTSVGKNSTITSVGSTGLLDKHLRSRNSPLESIDKSEETIKLLNLASISGKAEGEEVKDVVNGAKDESGDKEDLKRMTETKLSVGKSTKRTEKVSAEIDVVKD